MKNDVITLIAEELRLDAAGFRREAGRKETPVMAEVKSAKRTEYYQSVHAGLHVQLVAAVNPEDYRAAVLEAAGRRIRPTLASYDGTIYKIVREYQKRTRLELSLQEVEAQAMDIEMTGGEDGGI